MLRKKGRRGGGVADKFCELGFVSLSVYAHGNRLFFCVQLQWPFQVKVTFSIEVCTMPLLWCRSGALVSTKPQVRLGDLANVFCVILDRASAECCCFWAAARICCSPASHYKQRAGHSLPASPHSTCPIFLHTSNCLPGCSLASPALAARTST